MATFNPQNERDRVSYRLKGLLDEHLCGKAALVLWDEPPERGGFRSQEVLTGRVRPFDRPDGTKQFGRLDVCIMAWASLKSRLLEVHVGLLDGERPGAGGGPTIQPFEYTLRPDGSAVYPDGLDQVTARDDSRMVRLLERSDWGAQYAPEYLQAVFFGLPKQQLALEPPAPDWPKG